MQFSLLTVAVIVIVVWYAAKADERADVARYQAIMNGGTGQLPNAATTLASAVLAVGTAAGLSAPYDPYTNPGGYHSNPNVIN